MARDNIIDKGSTKTSPWFGYKYRVTPETSKLLQEAVFADGGGWGYTKGKVVSHLNMPFLVVRDNKITFSNDEYYFETSIFLPEKEPPKVETKALQEEKVSVQSHLHEGNKTSTVTGYDLSVGRDSTVTMARRFDGFCPEVMTSTDVNAVIKHFNQQEETTMSNVNRVVSVKFFDDDAGLKAEHALVAEYQVTTRVSDAMTVSKVLLTNDVAGDIDLHNKVRSETVDLHILKNTGNKVMLQPVEFEDLRVTVTNI